jgi:hypothetical protein
MSTNTAKIIAENPNETLDRQIDETRRFIRQIDFSLSFFSLLTVLLAVLFTAILADHWLFTDGLSMFLRLGVFFVLVLIIVFYVYRRIVPLLLYPINPVYAASLLEESSPSLKNSIVNWILLRKERLEQEERNNNNNKLSERIFDGVTQTAMSSVKVISSERAVDLRNVTRWGIALTLCFLFFVIYATFSPKSPLTSLTRIILPISKIEKPQAVRFLNIEPGNTVALQGEKLTISAEIVSRNNEPVYLFFSTDDGQAVRQAIPMSLPEGKTRYEVPFPPGKQGFASGVDYWIAQNNSRSGTFRINVRPTAAVEIVSLKYRFPHYTGLPEETIENSSDIRAVEGTEVKIGVRSTIPLQRIDLVFDNDPHKIVGMKISDEKPTEATATIILKLDPQTNTPTTIRNFSFRATDQEGYESRRSGVFRLEVLPDQPPMVQWADTDTKLKDVAQLDLPLNNSLELPIQAEDRDFGLRYLRFHVESGNKQIRPVELLESPATGATEHKGSIQRKAVFSPITSRLAEGDTAEIWAEAVDTKFPDPNNATTRRITVQIVAPQKQEQPPKENEKKPDDKKEKQNQEKNGKQDQEEQQNNAQQNNEEQNDKEQNKEQQENKQQETEKNRNQQGDTENREQNNNNPSEKPENNRENNENNEEKTGEKNEKQKSDDSQNGQNGGQNEEEQTKESTQQENSNTSESPNPDENSAGKNNNQNDSNQNNPDNKNSEQKNNDSLKNNSQNNNSSDNREQGKQNGKENQNQPVQEEQGDSSKKSDRQSNGSKKPINPETQDGDAMEEILKQMKKEGKFDDKKLSDNNSDHQNKNNPSNNNQNDNNQNNNEQNQNEQNQNEQNQNEQNQNEQNQNQKGAENQTDSKPANSTPDSSSEQQGQSEQDSEKQGAGKQGTEKQGESDSKQNNSQPNNSNKNDTKNSEQTNSNNGNNQQNDSVSERSKNQGNDQTSDQQRQNVPVDPADKTPRQRDDSLDPNSTERSNQGGDSSQPKKSDVDSANNSVTDGNKENSQETKQSNESESGKSGNSDQEIANRAGLPEGENSAAGKKPSDKTSQNSASENSTNDKNSANDKNDADNKNSAENSTENNTGQNMEKSTESNQSQSSSSKTENNPSSSAGSDNKNNLTTGGQGTSALNVETPTENANLEYSKKITNLVLEYLEDQLKSKPSQELLDNLGWSEQELRDFHHKWREMSEQSKRSESTTTNDDNKWKEAFKSLGLKPAQSHQQLQKSRTGVQDESKVTESQRFTPPPAIKNRFKRYTEGIGK